MTAMNLQRHAGAAALLLLLAGCAQPATSPAGFSPASSTPVSPGVPFWNSVEGGCPQLAGPNRKLAADNPDTANAGQDDETRYRRACSYGKVELSPAVHVRIDIARATDPGSDRRSELQYAERLARSGGH